MVKYASVNRFPGHNLYLYSVLDFGLAFGWPIPEFAGLPAIESPAIESVALFSRIDISLRIPSDLPDHSAYDLT